MSGTMVSRRPARFRILSVVHVVVGLLSLPLILFFGLYPDIVRVYGG